MPESIPLLTVFLSETVATAVLLLLGAGVVANAILPKTKGHGGGWLLINFGWGLAVMAAVYVGYRSGAHLNFAVTVGLLANGAEYYATQVDAAGEIVRAVPVTTASTLTYLAGEMLGAFLGAVVAWVTYKKHFDLEADPGVKLGVFSTGPELRNYGWNFVTEVVGTFILVFTILALGKTPSGLGPLAVSLLVVGIGASLGGPTGYAINPNRDLGPRIAHAILPIPGKGSSDWSYAWVPVVGPIVGGVLAGVAATAFII